MRAIMTAWVHHPKEKRGAVMKPPLGDERLEMRVDARSSSKHHIHSEVANVQ